MFDGNICESNENWKLLLWIVQAVNIKLKCDMNTKNYATRLTRFQQIENDFVFSLVWNIQLRTKKSLKEISFSSHAILSL